MASGGAIPEFRKDRRQLEIDLATIADKINKERPYFSRAGGNPWVKVVRTRMLSFSLARAARRVAVQLKQREQGPANEVKGEGDVRLSQLSCQRTHYDETPGARPFTACAVSHRLVGEVKYAVILGDQGGAVTLWSERGEMRRKMAAAHELRVTGLDVMPWAASRASEGEGAVKFLSSSADGVAKLWDAGGQELGVYDVVRVQHKHKKRLGSNVKRQRLGKCRFHPMHTYFATTSYDRSWALWDVDKTDLVLLRQEGHSTAVHCCAFHPDGSLIATVTC